MSHGDESSSSFAQGDDHSGVPTGKVRRTFPWVSVAVAVFILLFLAALVVPAVLAAREAARRASCAGHLKQLGLALHLYHDAHGCFPPAYCVDQQGRPVHSWRTLAMYYLEGGTYQQYDVDVPWNAASNQALLPRMPNVYHCPSDFQAKPTATSYVAVVGADTAWPFDQCRTLSDFATDGTSNTALVVETVDLDIPWTEPRDLEFTTMDFRVNSKLPTGMNSRHPGGVLVLMADGSPMLLKNDAPPNMVRLLFTVADGQPIRLP